MVSYHQLSGLVDQLVVAEDAENSGLEVVDRLNLDISSKRFREKSIFFRSFKSALRPSIVAESPDAQLGFGFAPYEEVLDFSHCV